ncbi:hypothetical protein KPH14_010925 [Odynerus spinipes]|uniref:Uncharacterized protein n=1 Tax=Odynerus spinipes TaxID=1348599 RepID=A0AAD9VLE1_9HYME|nr:hypothetical protein KPH14_010925 [Odynerus spinipes]
MYRKKWDADNKQMENEKTGNIVLTMKGSKIKDRISVFGNRVSIRIRPFVSLVKQCFKCFRDQETIRSQSTGAESRNRGSVNNYYSQFNSREDHISKEKRGLTYPKEVACWECRNENISSQVRPEWMIPTSEDESLKIFMNKLKYLSYGKRGV